MKGGGTQHSTHWTLDYVHRHFGFAQVHVDPEYCVSGLETILKYV